MAQELKRKKSHKDKKSKSVESAEKKQKQSKWVFEQLKKSDRETVDSFLEKNMIRLTQADATYDINPIMKFKHANFPKQLRKSLEKFPAPTFIQSVTWPPILKGEDLVVRNIFI